MSTKAGKRALSTGLLSIEDPNSGIRSMSPVAGYFDDVGIELRDVSAAKQRRPKDNFTGDKDTVVTETSSFVGSTESIDSNGLSRERSRDRSDLKSKQMTVTSDRDHYNDGKINVTSVSQGDGNDEDDTIELMDSPSKSVSLPKTPSSRQSTDLEIHATVLSAGSNRSWTKSDMNSEAPLDDSEYYCVDHMKLCSSKEAREDHANCEFLVPAFEWAEAQTMERDRRNVESHLQRLNVFAGTMIKERDEMKQQLGLSKEDVQDDFLDVVEELIAHLLTKQKQFMAHLDELHEKHMQIINDQIKRCKKIQQETGECLQQLNACPPCGDEYKKLKKKLQGKCPVYEEILRRDFNTATRLDYELRPDSWVDKIFQEVTSLGDVIAKPKEPRLPGFLSTAEETDFSKRTLQVHSRNDAQSSKDMNNCCLTGCTFIPDGRMIIADWNNTCLKMFNKRGVLIDRLTLNNNPWDVEVVDDGRVAVTVPGERVVNIISYNGHQLKVLSSFETDCECWGITVVGEKLAMTCDPWSRAPSVRMYTLAGKYVAFYQKDVNGHLLFSYPEHITTDFYQTTLYISDSRTDTVLALTVDGCLLFRYRHNSLSCPAGVSTDKQGFIYICGKDSRNVHQVSKSGELVRILLDNAELESPRAVCFETDGESLIVTDVGSTNCNEFIAAKFD